MSHKDLYQKGLITRTEYENAQHLKETGQRHLYKLYEKKLNEDANLRTKRAILISEGKPVPIVERRP